MLLNPYFYDFDIYHSPSSDIPQEHIAGENAKQLLLVVSKSDFTDENKAFLSKILGAVKYDLVADTSVVIIPDGDFYGVNVLMSNSKYSSAIIFGVNPKDIGFSIDTFLYAPFHMSGKGYLIAHPLETIKASTDHKKNLWTALQSLFPAT